MREYVQKVRILMESLPYIKEFKDKTVVIKYGGVALEDERIRATIIKDIAMMKLIGINPVVVHGGGVQITQMLKELNYESEFVGGLRKTDEKAAEVIQMVLSAKVNKKIVSDIQAEGVSAVGLCGSDGGLFEVRKIFPGGEDLGFVGEVANTNPKVLQNLIAGGFIPVVSPVSTAQNGDIYNINADYAALAVAAGLGAQKLIFLSDIEGVRRDVFDRNSVISHLKADAIDKYIEDGIISGGMIPKIQSCKKAIEEGVESVHILDGRLEHSLLLEVFTQHGIGTMIER
jgi:acetylglutamate kinase